MRVCRFQSPQIWAWHRVCHITLAWPDLDGRPGYPTLTLLLLTAKKENGQCELPRTAIRKPKIKIRIQQCYVYSSAFGFPGSCDVPLHSLCFFSLYITQHLKQHPGQSAKVSGLFSSADQTVSCLFLPQGPLKIPQVWTEL